MAFFAYVHQDGGCDYTIECGSTLWHLAATDLAGAQKEVEDRIGEGYTGERRLATVFLIEGEIEEVDVEGIYGRIAEKDKQAAKKRKEKEERAQLEKLKAKYEK